MRWFCLAIVGWLALLIAPAASAQSPVAVIVAPTSTLTSLKRVQLVDIFLRRVSRLPDGKPAVPCDQAAGPAKEAFYQTFFDYSQDEIRDYWIREIYVGGKHPPDFSDSRDDAAMKHRISQKAGSIGYIRRSALDDTVREVSITP